MLAEQAGDINSQFPLTFLLWAGDPGVGLGQRHRGQNDAEQAPEVLPDQAQVAGGAVLERVLGLRFAKRTGGTHLGMR
jgi:hypothetical protein